VPEPTGIAWKRSRTRSQFTHPDASGAEILRVDDGFIGSAEDAELENASEWTGHMTERRAA
jgi:hypothetical protein